MPGSGVLKRSHQWPVWSRLPHPAWRALALILVLFGLIGCGPIYDSDVWWHLRTGELILGTHSIPRADTYSWSVPGKRWVLDSWGFDVVIAMVHRVGGLVGVSLYRGMASVAVGAMIAVLCRRSGARPWSATIASALAMATLFVFVVQRPWTVGFVLLPCAVMLAQRALEGSSRALTATVVIVIGWANLHFGVVLGVGVVVALAVGHAVEHKQLRRPAALSAAVLIAVVVNPYGMSLYTHVLQVRQVSSGVREWSHLDPTRLPDAQVFVFIVAIAAALAVTGRWRQPSKVLPLLLLGALTVDALRNGPFLVILGAAEVALAVDQRSTIKVPMRSPVATLAVAGWVSLAALGVLYATRTAGSVRSEDFPISAVHGLPAGCRLFNQYTLGGFIEWYRPDVPASMDGRNDLFGNERVDEQIRVLSDDPTATASLSWLDQRQVDCVLIPPNAELAKTLEHNAGWRLSSQDASAALFIRARP